MTGRTRAEGDSPPVSLLKAWPWWLPPALLTLTLALIFNDPFAGDWDALDYTILSLRGEPSSMLFGRMLFIFFNHTLWRAAHALFGLAPADAYLLFKYAVTLQSPLAVVAGWALARELTGDVRSATIAALLLGLSPFFIIYSGQAMTEIPSLLLLCLALTIHLRGLRHRRLGLVLLGAALLGASVNVREVTALYGPWLLLAPFLVGGKFGRREVAITLAAVVLFFVCALGPFASWYLLDVGGHRAAWHGWIESMRMESALHPVTARNLGPLLTFFFIAAPIILVVLPVALLSEWRARGFSPVFVLALVGLGANLMMIAQYSTVINGRYLLTGLPGLAPLVANYLVRFEERRVVNRRRALAVVVAGVLFVTLVVGVSVYPIAWPTIQSHGRTRDYLTRLAALPRENAVVIAGGQTVSVTFWRGVGAGEWEVIGTGGGWPGDDRLVGVIEEHLRAGRRVFLDADPRWWTVRDWQRPETEAIARLGEHFRFRHTYETIYEVRPRDDESARDLPDLQRLLEG